MFAIKPIKSSADYRVEDSFNRDEPFSAQKMIDSPQMELQASKTQQLNSKDTMKTKKVYMKRSTEIAKNQNSSSEDSFDQSNEKSSC